MPGTGVSVALTGATVFDGENFVEDHAVVIAGQRIDDVIANHELDPNIATVQLPGGTLAPGFIDIQVNGGTLKVEFITTVRDIMIKI